VRARLVERRMAFFMAADELGQPAQGQGVRREWRGHAGSGRKVGEVGKRKDNNLAGEAHGLDRLCTDPAPIRHGKWVEPGENW